MQGVTPGCGVRLVTLHGVPTAQGYHHAAGARVDLETSFTATGTTRQRGITTTGPAAGQGALNEYERAGGAACEILNTICMPPAPTSEELELEMIDLC